MFKIGKLELKRLSMLGIICVFLTPPQPIFGFLFTFVFMTQAHFLLYFILSFFQYLYPSRSTML